MTKWLNPDATQADLGESMQAYYDEKLGVWVFPGEDPAEKAKPVGPPPTTPIIAEDRAVSCPAPAPADPLAAMMAPPTRVPTRASSVGPATNRAPIPGMMPGGPPTTPSASGAPPPPQFSVFQPKPTPDGDEKE